MEVTKFEHLLSFPKEKEKMMNIINTGESSNRKKRDSVRLHQLQNPKKQIFFSSSLFLFEPHLTRLPTLPRASPVSQFKPISFDPIPMVVVVVVEEKKCSDSASFNRINAPLLLS